MISGNKFGFYALKSRISAEVEQGNSRGYKVGLYFCQCLKGKPALEMSVSKPSWGGLFTLLNMWVV